MDIFKKLKNGYYSNMAPEDCYKTLKEDALLHTKVSLNSEEALIFDDCWNKYRDEHELEFVVRNFILRVGMRRLLQTRIKDLT